MRRLYELHAQPLAKVVHGLPTSWKQSIAATKFPTVIDTAVWSPCSMFIAVVFSKSKGNVEILDAVTLGRRTVLDFPLNGTRWLVFSPCARMLTWFGESPEKFVSWDLQTGSLVSTIPPEQQGRTQDCFSATYSACGTMLGVPFRNDGSFTISTYNVRSGTHIYSHSIGGPVLSQIWIWADGEYLQFATTKSGSITTWEVGFTSTDAPREVQSLSIPGDPHRSGHSILHPNLSRLAFVTGGKVKVWCARGSKFLLESAPDVKWPRQMSLSIDGRFFTCGTNGPNFYVWKESPAGYILHQKLTSNTQTSKPRISPNGESIIAFGDSVIQLWRTTDSTTSTQVSQRSKRPFILGFSPDEALAGFTRTGGKTVTVLDLKSGTPRLVVDTDMKVYGLGVGGDTVVVVGEGKIVGWKLPAGDINATADVNYSRWTTTFDYPSFPISAQRPTISVSPDLGHVAIVNGGIDSHLHVYDVHAGQCLVSVPVGLESSPWFATDGCHVWCVTDGGEAESWGIVEDTEPDVTELEHRESTTHPPDGFPWRPSRGYSILDGRWALSSSKKRLLWLPPHWRSDGWNRMWSGRFLALLDCELPEPVILELDG